MSDYFDEMGWTPLADGEAPDYLLQMARFMRDYGLWNLFEQYVERLSPPASRTAVENLKEIKIESDSNKKQCPICLKEFEVNDLAKSMPCHHVFHQDCILPWLSKV